MSANLSADDHGRDPSPEFLDQYRSYRERVLEPTRLEIKKTLSRWKEPDYWAKYHPDDSRLPYLSPVQRVIAGIKRPESVVDKILRKPESFPDGLAATSFIKMTDAVRSRAVVYVLSQFPIIDREIRSNPRLQVSDDHPPVAYLSPDLATRMALPLRVEIKESGYAAIHYVLRLRDSALPVDQRPWFELQVRTLVEDAWGEIEHVLGYKPGRGTEFSVRRQFQLISKLLETVDDHFNFLFGQLSTIQEHVRYSGDDQLNAENLPAVLGEHGMVCAQQEIDGLLKLLISRGIRTVGSLRSVAAPRQIEIVMNSYVNEFGRNANTFEVVANLANLANCESEGEQIARIRAHIAFQRETMHMRGIGRGVVGPP